MSATEHTPASLAEADSASMESTSLSDAEASAGCCCATAAADAVPLPPASPEESSTAPSPEDAHAASSEASSTAAAVEIDTNAQNRRGRPFEPGHSGNPHGRPKGSRNRVTQVVEALIHGQAEALVAKTLEKALAGDSSLLRALCTPLMPRRSERTIEFELPKIETAADVVAASSAVLAACSRGELSPSEASDVMSLISMHVNTIKDAEFEERLCALEGKKVP